MKEESREFMYDICRTYAGTEHMAIRRYLQHTKHSDLLCIVSPMRRLRIDIQCLYMRVSLYTELFLKTSSMASLPNLSVAFTTHLTNHDNVENLPNRPVVRQYQTELSKQTTSSVSMGRGRLCSYGLVSSTPSTCTSYFGTPLSCYNLN